MNSLSHRLSDWWYEYKSEHLPSRRGMRSTVHCPRMEVFSSFCFLSFCFFSDGNASITVPKNKATYHLVHEVLGNLNILFDEKYDQLTQNWFVGKLIKRVSILSWHIQTGVKVDLGRVLRCTLYFGRFPERFLSKLNFHQALHGVSFLSSLQENGVCVLKLC